MRVCRACIEHCEFLDVCIMPDVCINMHLQRERGHRRPWLHGCLHDLLGWDLWGSVEGRGGRARLACREGTGRLVGRLPKSVRVTSAGARQKLFIVNPDGLYYLCHRPTANFQLITINKLV